MKRLLLSLNFAIILLSSLGMYFGGKASTDLNDQVKQLTQIVQEKDSIIKINENFAELLDSNTRLKRHYLAVKYSYLEPNPENIKSLLKEAGAKNVEYAYCVARLETGNGKAGCGKSPSNNHFGMKIPNHRFSWKENVSNSGYAVYKSWTFSYMDYLEYKDKGHADWQRDAIKRCK